MKRGLRFRFLPYAIVIAVAGCASLGDPRVNVPQYKTLVVRDFDNAAGNALPSRIHRDLPDAVITHLTQCYPGAFDKIVRSGSGAAQELVVDGVVTEYNLGRPAMGHAGSIFGKGSAIFKADVSFYDGQNGQQLMLAKGDWAYRYGGVKGAIWSVGDLLHASGASVADLIAQKRGATRRMTQECAKYEQ
jgi:hypothetical protein